jgi:hypothetical protein
MNMRMKLALMVGITGLAVAGWSAASWAHHAFAAEFDADKPVTFKGVITKMEWVNPHSWLHVDVKNTDGTVANWAIEAGTPNVLFRRGFTKDSLLPGTEIMIDGYQSNVPRLVRHRRSLRADARESGQEQLSLSGIPVPRADRDSTD